VIDATAKWNSDLMAPSFSNTIIATKVK
jgi:hypothetical protein